MVESVGSEGSSVKVGGGGGGCRVGRDMLR